MSDSNTPPPTLPVIVTTSQPQESETNASNPSPTSRPDLTISTSDSTPSPQGSGGNEHGRNYSISSIPPSVKGHSKNTSSLGSAAGNMLQVPGSTSSTSNPLSDNNPDDSSSSNSSPTTTHHHHHQHPPSSPTISVLSDSSSTNPTNQKTSLAFRNHDNTHARKVSNAHSDISGISELGGAEGDGGSNEKENPSENGEVNAKTTISHPASSNLNSAKKESKSQSQDIPDLDRLTLWQKIKLLRPGASDRYEAAKLQASRERAKLADPSPFKHRPHELGELVDPKSVETLRDLGGIEGLLKELGTTTNGLNVPINGIELEKKDMENDAGNGNGGRFDPNDRKRVYGENQLPPTKSKSLLMLMWMALQDKILVLLLFFAVISLALGLYTDFGADPEQVPCADPPPGQEGCNAAKIDWVEGVAILIAVAVVAGVGAVNDYQKELQFRKLNAKKEERDVKVRRYGQEMTMSVYDVMVGDVLLLEAGEILPADGVFLKGGSVKCDESGATGESDMVRKCTYEEALKDLERKEREPGWKKPNRDCFLISGSRVLEGVGEYVVIAVGQNSFNGRLLLSLRVPPDTTPLQAKLNRLAGLIAKLGSAAGLLLFVALMIRFFVQLKTRPNGRDANDKAQDFIDILIIAVTLVVVAVPEGLPLAVTLALAFATKRMTGQNLLVRLLGSCETMANASVICTDKTGTLTQNEMSVVAGSVGAHCKFAYRINENSGRIDTNSISEAAPTSTTGRNGKDFAIDQHSLSEVIKGPLRELFNDAIAVNSTAFEEAKEGKEEAVADKGLLSRAKRALFGSFINKSQVSDRKAAIAHAEAAASIGFVGSKTETALLKLAKELSWEDYRIARERAQVVQLIPFSSERKAMGVVVKLPNGKFRLHVKGASEVLSKLCERFVQVSPPSNEGSTEGEIKTEEFTEDTRDNIAKTIIFYANQSLRTIAVCYRDFESWPPKGVNLVEKKEEGEANISSSTDVSGLDANLEVPYESLAQDLTLLAITGIEDPLRPGVREAVATCGKAGVSVKMCTGDNVLTARSIATQCGIYTPGGIIMEGPIFRQLSPQDRAEILPRLQVLARSSPEDKKILVEGLKSLGEVVGVTGDGTNDGPALKTANVGFAMGIAGTEVAKEASDIILMDDNFASIVSAIMWGRCVNDAVRKFLQFQLSVNIVAVVVTFVTAVASVEEQSALTAVQLLWLNLIMDTLAALALATDPATPALLDRKPDRRTAPLISTDMWKMIIGQSIYQMILVMVLHFRGHEILNLGNSADPILDRRQETELSALVFNTFVFCQLFNQVNCRRLDRKYNFLEGIHKNIWFMLILAIEVGAQVLIMYVGGAAFSVTRLSGRDWGIAIVAGFISWPLGALIRTIPTKPIDDVLIKLGLMPDPNALPKYNAEGEEEDSKEKRLEKEEEAKNFNEPALGEVAERLGAFARIRGGRARASSFVFKTRAQRMRDADVHPQSLMALVPALIGASIGGSWAPSNPAPSTIADPTAGDPTVSSVALFQGQEMQLHPETHENDEFKRKLTRNGTQ